jgi:crossover junction endodeoxyribonuclease RuvC
MCARLALIHSELSAIIRDGAPDAVSVESVFVHRNIQSALTLGQARGAALAAVGQAGLQIHEYAPAAIKSAVVGNGRAEKQQVQHMVGILLGVPLDAMASDAADALAIAICHAHHSGTPGGTSLPAGMRWGRR